ncbi:hypothetical protein IRJ41_017141, partial [Triplophysa rosa]
MGKSIYILNHYTAFVILLGTKSQLARQNMPKYINSVNHTVYIINSSRSSKEEAESIRAANRF